MSGKRTLLRALTRSSQAPAPAVSSAHLRPFHILRRAPLRPQPSSFKASCGQTRWSSSGPSNKYSFEELRSRLPTSSSPSSSIIIIDVREPGELSSTGRIPGAHNIPISSAPDGLFLPAEEFAERWGFEKPEQGDEVVFYCKAGVRSRAAAAMAKEGGWEGVKLGEYPGSWVDWEKRGGEVER